MNNKKKKNLAVAGLSLVVRLFGHQRVSALICKACQPNTMLGWHAWHCNWEQLVDELWPENSCEACDGLCAGAWCDACTREYEGALSAWYA